MRRSLFKSKIHRATVTDADLEYEGSVTLDEQLMKAADILPYERVHIWNVTNGSRLETYALEGPAGSGVVCINGAAARHAHPGDRVIIATFADVEGSRPGAGSLRWCAWMIGTRSWRVPPRRFPARNGPPTI